MRSGIKRDDDIAVKFGAFNRCICRPRTSHSGASTLGIVEMTRHDGQDLPLCWGSVAIGKQLLQPLSDAPVLGTVFSMAGGEMTSLCGGDF
jgi:hypothetical protein